MWQLRVTSILQNTRAWHSGTSLRPFPPQPFADHSFLRDMPLDPFVRSLPHIYEPDFCRGVTAAKDGKIWIRGDPIRTDPRRALIPTFLRWYPIHHDAWAEAHRNHPDLPGQPAVGYRFVFQVDGNHRAVNLGYIDGGLKHDVNRHKYISSWGKVSEKPRQLANNEWLFRVKAAGMNAGIIAGDEHEFQYYFSFFAADNEDGLQKDETVSIRRFPAFKELDSPVDERPVPLWAVYPYPESSNGSENSSYQSTSSRPSSVFSDPGSRDSQTTSSRRTSVSSDSGSRDSRGTSPSAPRQKPSPHTTVLFPLNQAPNRRLSSPSPVSAETETVKRHRLLAASLESHNSQLAPASVGEVSQRRGGPTSQMARAGKP